MLFRSERLTWEEEHDCISRYKNWLVEQGIASEQTIQKWEKEDLITVERAAKDAHAAYQEPIVTLRSKAAALISALSEVSSAEDELESMRTALLEIAVPLQRDIAAALQESLILTRGEKSAEREAVSVLAREMEDERRSYYQSFLVSGAPHSPLTVKEIPAHYSLDAPTLMGFEVLNAAFDAALAREPR